MATDGMADGPAAPPPGTTSPGAPPPPGVAAPTGAPPFATPSPARPSPAWTPSGPKPRSLRWVVVLVAALALTVGAAIAGTVLFVDRTLPPYNAAHEFVRDVIHGRTSAAAARLCAADREHSQDAIDTVRSSFGFDATTITVNVLAVDRDGDRATVDYDVDIPHDPTTYHLQMRQEGGAWKACPGSGLR